MSIQDGEIIKLFFERSEQAIRELETKYGHACFKLSFNILGDRQDAEECINDAYLGVWNAIPPTKPDPLLTFVLKIVRNISLKNTGKKELKNEIAPIPFQFMRLSCLSQHRTQQRVKSMHESWQR